MEEKCW